MTSDEHSQMTTSPRSLASTLFPVGLLLIAMASNVILYLLERRFGRGVRGPQT